MKNKNFLSRFFGKLFGELSWNPPGWAQPLVPHRKRILISLLILVVLAVSGFFGWQWWANRPIPNVTHVTAEKILLTPVVKDKYPLKPRPLVLDFSRSAAPLDRLHKTAVGVKIDPAISGEWKWKTDTKLEFTPKQDWPANTSYEITLEHRAVSPTTKLDHYSLDVKTQPFSVGISEFTFYQNPKSPAEMQAVATLSFPYSVDRVDLARKISFAMIGGSSVFSKSEKDGKLFTLKFANHDHTAYLRSAALHLPKREDFMKLIVAKGLATTQGGAETTNQEFKKMRIPDRFSFFRIHSVKGQIVHDKQGDPEQFLIVHTTSAAEPENVGKGLHVYLLPKNKPATAFSEVKKNYRWKSPGEVTPAILKLAKPVAFKLVPSEKKMSKMQTFRVVVSEQGYLYIKIDKGVQALGNFQLGNDYVNVVPVPNPGKQITIEGHGGVLALNGERKLSIKSRGVSKIEYDIARIPVDEINHLVSQTRGKFQDPDFVNYHFGINDMARIATEKQSIQMKDRFTANYSAFDFGKQLEQKTKDGKPMHGLFYLTAREFKPHTQWNSPGIKDERLILVTDLGLLVKTNSDKSHDVFVESIQAGSPLANVSVEILARNGVPLVSGTTDADGRVKLPSLGDLKNENAPVAFVTRLGDDVSFMPYARNNRELNFSRFDIGGVASKSGADLNTFVFTERGIYRPGDLIHAGVIIKRRDWKTGLAGLPIEIEVFDSRGQSVQKQKIALPKSGFLETHYQTSYGSPSGAYHINVYLVKKGNRKILLGSAKPIVKEFQPDRMKMSAKLSVKKVAGWIHPQAVDALINLQNLYGAPAVGHRIQSKMSLWPSRFSFSEYPDYVFYDASWEKDKKVQYHHIDLGETKTDAKGDATVHLGLDRFSDATYSMTVYCEGFEASGGRSVTREINALVSPLAFVVGYKSDSDLGYIPANHKAAIHFIAVNPKLKKIAVSELHCDLIQKNYVSVLSKQGNGNYAYQSVLKEKTLNSKTVKITPQGFDYAVPSGTPGNYRVELRAANNKLVSSADFSIIGKGTQSRSLAKNAELEIKLDKKHYQPGDQIAVSITAPYTGSGLITIERDKVYAWKWFKMTKNSEVEKIIVPQGFEGTGYINVSLVRSLDSKAVFMSPLSYGVVSFQANLEKRKLKIDLETPALAVPGKPLAISYKTDRPSKIVIFAVDEGILQVTNYKTPDPLGYFFRKAALVVSTSQIMDLILPEFSIWRSVSAFGGGAAAKKHLNPFKRVTKKPVVFWSGIIDSDTTPGKVTYDVPDYFSGSLKIMAVAVSDDAVGNADRKTLVHGPFVITPNVPVEATPGDVFDVGVTIANEIKGSGKNAAVNLKIEPSKHLEVLNAPTQPLAISEGHDLTATFKVRVKDKLGSASLKFTASHGKDVSQLDSTLSIRPPLPSITTVKSGNFQSGSVEVKKLRAMHPEFSKREAVLSALPLGLAHGLDVYLKNYPNGCSEQITSGAFCRLMLAGESDFGFSQAEIRKQLNHTFEIERTRQNDQGGFGYWTANDTRGINFVSVYVTDFLVSSKEAGFNPPPDILRQALKNLNKMVEKQPHDLQQARILAYAIYVLTRENVITTNYILNLEDYLNRAYKNKWQSDLTGVYLAGSLKMLKKDDAAQKLIHAYKMGDQPPSRYWDFYSQLGSDSQYVSVVALNFPDLMNDISAKDFQSILRPIGEGNFNTLSAAYAVQALKCYSESLAKTAPKLAISELFANDKVTPLSANGKLFKQAQFSPDAIGLRFSVQNAVNQIGAFYQVIETGYNRAMPKKIVHNGLEVEREYVDQKGNVIDHATLGEPVTVRINVRSLTHKSITNVAVEDLLPGGFEILSSSLRPGSHTVPGWNFVEVREDRAVFFGTVGTHVKTIKYQIKADNTGTFIVPPVFAESMYDRKIHGCGLGGKIVVRKVK